jgi:hypothetical protein
MAGCRYSAVGQLPPTLAGLLPVKSWTATCYLCSLQVSKVADLLAPVIEILDTQPSLSDPVKTRGGASGRLACSLA